MKKRDGKQLENLVAFVEGQLKPAGCVVETNTRLYENGEQVAEFDVTLAGKFGSTEIRWLIECRDRPSQQKIGRNWIEQLNSRREEYGFNKVTAVATTGYSPAAQSYAKRHGIELRTVTQLTPEEFSTWLPMEGIRQRQRLCQLTSAKLGLPPTATEEQMRTVLATLIPLTGHEPILNNVHGEQLSLVTAFTAACDLGPNIFDGIVANHPAVPVRLRVQYQDAGCLSIRTDLGDIPVPEILFEGTIAIKEALLPLQNVSQYAQLSTGEEISQSAHFEPFDVNGTKFALELHRIPETGCTNVILRVVETPMEGKKRLRRRTGPK